MLKASLDFPFLIAPSVSPNPYFDSEHDLQTYFLYLREHWLFFN